MKVERISKRNVVSEGLYAEGSRILRAHGGTSALLVDLDGIQTLRGSHNAQNAAAAIAACLAVGVSEEEVRAGLKSFPGSRNFPTMGATWLKCQRETMWVPNLLRS